jgi:hypothetical protein
LNDPAITSLKEDVARLALDNQTIKTSLGGDIVRIDNEAFHSPEEVRCWVVDRIGPGTLRFLYFGTTLYDILQQLLNMRFSIGHWA